MTEEAKTIVHVLVEGRAFCGLAGLPKDWPAGHKWVALGDSEQGLRVNCAACIAGLRGEHVPPDEIYTKATEGRYDAEASAVLELVRAEAVIVIVKQGLEGDGFSLAVDTRKATPKAILAGVPNMLRGVADSIEQQERERAKDLQ